MRSKSAEGNGAALLVRGAFASLATRVFGVALSYVAAVVLSRSLGVGGYGAYSVALAWALILVLPSRAGLDFTALRYGAIYLDQGDRSRLKALARFTGILVAGLSIVMGAIVYGLTAAGLTRVPPALGVGMALVILPVAMLALVAAFLRNMGQIVASQFYEQVLRPAVLIAALGGLIIAGKSLSPANAMVLTGAAALIAMTLGLTRAVRAMSLGSAPANYGAWREWVGLSVPIFFATIIQELLNQLDIIMLGYLDTPAAAGRYSAAWRLASLVTFGLVALGTVNGPLIAAAHARDDRRELERVARLTARLGFAASLLLAVALTLAGKSMLRLFGDGFAEAYPALLVLLAGALTNAFTGAVAYLMTMTGRQLQALAIFAVALLISFSLNLLLIPRFSIVGAAIASSSATIAWNVGMLVYVWRVLGIDASPLGLARQTLR